MQEVLLYPPVAFVIYLALVAFIGGQLPAARFGGIDTLVMLRFRKHRCTPRS